jgi:hypothetical protein
MPLCLLGKYICPEILRKTDAQYLKRQTNRIKSVTHLKTTIPNTETTSEVYIEYGFFTLNLNYKPMGYVLGNILFSLNWVKWELA